MAIVPSTTVASNGIRETASVRTGAPSTPQVAAPPADASNVSISPIAARLGRAENAFPAGLSRQELGDRVRANIARINYPLTAENKVRVAQERPNPADAAALASSEAANKYVDNLGGPNPFAGLPREQLWTIANDDSGTFTTNERYAAYRQVYEEEQAWRTKAVAKAMQEYHETGKLTNFFGSVLEHFNGLPAAEQALYPGDYAADLQKKVELDFNYRTHRAHDGAAPTQRDGIRDLVGFPQVYA